MFCTVADLEKVLQQEIPAEKVDAATQAIESVTAAIRNYCGQILSVVADEELTLDSIGDTRLFLPELPVTAVAEVVEDGETLAVVTDYKLGQAGILHRIGQRWAKGIQVVTVTYTHGYATLPVDIVTICTRAAARCYQMGLRAAEMAGVPGVSAMSLGDYSVTFGSEGGGIGGQEGILGVSAAPLLTSMEKEMLNRYRA